MFHCRCCAAVAALGLLTLAACSGGGLMSRFTIAGSPYQRYADALRTAALGDTAMGRDWLRAGDEALQRPLAITLPMRESGYFPADQPTAVGYRFELTRGRRFALEVTFETAEPGQLFVDLFEDRGVDDRDRVASLTEGTALTYDVRRDGTYILRLQPELLRSGRYTVVQRTLASLPFPISGLDAKAVQSEFGAARDAGRREHEGIDIFAPRNTPVVAVVDGTARPDTNPLGGNVVWIRDRRQPRSFYYAHLARSALEDAAAVRAGDIVGYIGNTGNARGGPPHLHFGIYQGGAIDPLPFLKADDPVPKPHTGGDLAGKLVRVTSSRATLRSGTPPAATPLVQLSRSAVARVIGVTDGYLRVELPDRSSGYLDRAAVTPAQTPLRQQRLGAGSVLRERPQATAPAVHIIVEPVTVDVVGEFAAFTFVRPASGPAGWIEMKTK